MAIAENKPAMNSLKTGFDLMKILSFVSCSAHILSMLGWVEALGEKPVSSQNAPVASLFLPALGQAVSLPYISGASWEVTAGQSTVYTSRRDSAVFLS